jgi:prolyl-tRNA synthetase
MMQDGKALQAGTSHFLGQNFAKAFDVKYSNKENKTEYVWASSWGVSTRLVGALIMTHSDDEGLVLPPKLAPIQVVLVPIPKPLPEIMEKINEIGAQLKEMGVRIKIDDNDQKRPGFKFAEYEMMGVPIRIGIGKRDIENGVVEVARRDTKEKTSVVQDGIANYIKALLDEIQDNLLARAKSFRKERTSYVDSMEEFQKVLEEKGGFILAHWDGTSESELKIKELTNATIRCIPDDFVEEEGKCIISGNTSKGRVLFAKSY